MNDIFNLPDVGEGLTEADISSWKVAVGDEVTVNQILVEIETAKSLVELPSPQAGTIAELYAAEGDTVDVGSPIVRFGSPDGGAAPAGDSGTASSGEDAAEAGSASADDSDEGASGATLVGYGAVASSSKRRPRKAGAAPAAQSGAVKQEPAQAAAASQTTEPAAQSAAPGGSRPLAKPPVRKAAKDAGVDLASVPATGPRGEVTRADLTAYLDGGAAQPSASAQPEAASAAPIGSSGLPEERLPLKGVKKAMAQAMVNSAFTAPHVTIGVDVDVTETMALVRRLKSSQALGEGVRVSPMLIVAKAMVWAAQRHPMMNAVIDGDEIVLRDGVNLGIAAATDRGLIVPNIKGAHTMGLGELATAIGELTETARSGKTTPAAQSGGTLTLTNIGVFGVDWGTPIINPGESAIVAIGRAVKKPWVVDGEIRPRDIMSVTVSADHRIVDGATIAAFLRDIANALEEPATLLI